MGKNITCREWILTDDSAVISENEEFVVIEVIATILQFEY